MVKLAPPNKLLPLGELVNERPELAVEPLEDLARQYPSDGQVLYALGLALLNVGDIQGAISRLEAAVKRERHMEDTIYHALSQAYSLAGMPAHAHRAATRAGLNPPPWQETLRGDWPEHAKLADLLEFEEARRDTLRPGPQASAALRKMQAFSRKFPEYRPALNVIGTALFSQGKFSEAREEITKVLRLDARNVHALLNLARIERLLGGVPAVEALREQVEAARKQDEGEELVASGELALASIYLLMEDAGAARAALERHLEGQQGPQAREQAEDSEEVQQIQERLERHEQFPDAPLMLPGELLPPLWVTRWQATPGKRMLAEIERDLLTIPGWFQGVEQGLTFEGKFFSGLLTTALVNPDQAAMPDGVTPAERLERLLARLAGGRGSLDGLVGVGQALQVLNLMPEDAVVRGPDGQELQALSLELVNEPLDIMNSRQDQKRHEQALGHLMAGRVEQAHAELAALAEKYPDLPSLRFNMINALAQSGRPGAEAEARQLTEELAGQYPHYLFPPARLALLAIHDGDFEGARRWLAWPRGLKKLHVLEYGYFQAVQGILNLYEGDLDSVKTTQDILRQLLDEDSMPLRLLHQEILKKAGEASPDEALNLLERLE